LPEADDELPRVTRRHLRLGDDACGRRLAAELFRARDHHHNRAANVRFEVSQRVEADARLAHAEMRAPRPGDFPAARDLLPEQQRVHAAAAAGYLALFGDVAARASDAVDPFSTSEAGVSLTGGVGIALDRADGGREVRALRIGHRADDGLLDDVDLRFGVLRIAPWAGGGRVDLVTADLLTLEQDRRTIDLETELQPARSWLTQRVEWIDDVAVAGRVRPGADCRDCPVVAGCRAHSSRGA
jgi:hypothetical protein